MGMGYNAHCLLETEFMKRKTSDSEAGRSVRKVD